MNRLRSGGWAVIAIMLATAAPAAAQADVARLLAAAETQLRASDVEQARATANEALAIVERVNDGQRLGDTILLLSRIESSAGNRALALEHAQRAMTAYEKSGDGRGVATAALEIADLREFESTESESLLEAAAAAAHAAGDAELEGVVLHALGDRLFIAERFKQSLEVLTRAEALFEIAGAIVDLGTVYNSIGRVYRVHGRLDEALRYQKAALELHRKSDNKFTLLQSLNAVAVVSQRLNDLTAARSYLQEAIGVAAALPPTPRSLQARDFLRANMADVLADAGEFESAAAALEEVIAGGRDEFPSTRYSQLARAYVALRRGPEAAAAAEKAVALCGTSKMDCIEGYNVRSDAEAITGDRNAALRDLSLTLGGIEELRAQLVPSDFFKQDFSTYYGNVYGSMIARQADAGLARESLETAERARSRAFLDLLASRAIAPAADGRPTAPSTLRGRTAASSGVTSPVSTAAASADDLIRTAARLRSTLLLYWVSDQETFIWVVTPEGRITDRRVQVPRSRLLALVRRTAPFAANSGPSQPSAATAVLQDATVADRALYALLIAPIKTVLPNRNGALLTVVPHDALTGVSFAALQDPSGRYLIEDYTLHYAAAGAILHFTSRDHRPQPRDNAMLMVADPNPARGSAFDPQLPRLPGARLEATAITRQMQASRVMSLAGAAATESAIRENAPKRSILHFAAHTVVRDDDPFASYLALGRSSDSEDTDGVLTAQDVYRLNLPADLVVLSACRSASGTVAGDGVAAFARAFVYAGAASIIASMWEVADQPSNRLLPEFYRAWFGGATKAAALRQAQLRLLRDLRAGRVHVTTPVGPIAIPEHPVFWAGFVLFGEPE